MISVKKGLKFDSDNDLILIAIIIFDQTCKSVENLIGHVEIRTADHPVSYAIQVTT